MLQLLPLDRQLALRITESAREIDNKAYKRNQAKRAAAYYGAPQVKTRRRQKREAE